MSIAITCPACGGQLKAPDTAIGKRVRCPKCAKPVTVPVAVADDVGFEVVDTDDDVPPPRPRKKLAVKNRKPLFIGLGAIALLAISIGIYYATTPKRYTKKDEDEFYAKLEQLGMKVERPKHHDWSTGTPPGLKPWDNPALTGEERRRMQNEEWNAEKVARDQAAKSIEAAKYRVNLIAVRKVGGDLQVEYEFTKGFEDGKPPPISMGFVISQGGKQSVFNASTSGIAFTKKGSLRIINLSGADLSGYVEVWMSAVDVFSKPEYMISNVMKAQ